MRLENYTEAQRKAFYLGLRKFDLTPREPRAEMVHRVAFLSPNEVNLILHQHKPSEATEIIAEIQFMLMMEEKETSAHEVIRELAAVHLSDDT